MTQQKTVITRQMVYDATKKICEENGLEDTFLESFWEGMLADDEIYLEYVHYLLHGDFACKAQVAGVTITDVLVWQIDHFKAQLDVDTTLTKRRSGSMVLLAFDTFLKMKKNPEAYLAKMQEDTGTDYPGKFNGL
ncbi:MAG: hypothetical protein K6E75_08525 [Lachnospiraceae bacterium]|nr:hypothetical protein [Lachnospiraceae bacterium]